LPQLTICRVVRFVYFGNTFTVRVSALCQHLAVSQCGVAAFSEAIMPERSKRQFIAKASSADDLFDRGSGV
jgi:hypothetical protein